MTLITLLIVLTIERVSATLDIWQFPFYYQKMKDVIFKHMGQPAWLENSVSRWLLIVVPVLVIWFLSSAMNWLVLEFIFNIVVLLICIGCVKQRKLYKSFLNASNRGDTEAAENYKAQLRGLAEDTATSASESTEADKDSEVVNASKGTDTVAEAVIEQKVEAVVEEKVEEKAEETVEAVVDEQKAEPAVEQTVEPAKDTTSLGQTVVWLNFRYYCAILFWFVCFGGAGAVLYCMVRETADDKDEKIRAALPQDQLQKLLHLLDWIPARVCSAGYLLIGNFSRAAGVWVSYLLDFTSPAKSLITDIALAAETVDAAKCGKTDEATCMLKLAKRNVLFFLALVALLTLYGGVR